MASEGGGYCRIRDLCEHLSSSEHVDRPVVERILAELHEQGYLQPHGFKNRYGADDKLHELIDLRMIYGNFPVGSSQIEVRHEGRVLGVVPRDNLLRVRAGRIVRFAGKCWRVRKASADGYQVEPTKPTPRALDFVYAGQPPGLDPFICDRIWTCLHRKDLEVVDLQKSLRPTIDSLCGRIREATTLDSIPYEHCPGGFRYYTFAGSIVNRMICAFIGASKKSAGDFSLVAQPELDWHNLPYQPEGFGDVLDAGLNTSAEQTLYQRLLPNDMQSAEMKERWLRDKSIADILRRLNGAHIVEVTRDLFKDF